jgi:Fe2+ or Zn2+ uptake regulation protein
MAGKSENWSLVLKEAKLKNTPIRRAVLDFLANKHGPFSIEDIHHALKDTHCNLVTIYRTVESLEQANILRRCHTGDNVSRYEYLADEKPHHHIICKECRHVEVLHSDVVAIDLKKLQRKGFKKVLPYFDLYGVCEKCS